MFLHFIPLHPGGILTTERARDLLALLSILSPFEAGILLTTIRNLYYSKHGCGAVMGGVCPPPVEQTYDGNGDGGFTPVSPLPD